MTIFLTEHDAARLGIDGATPRTTRGRSMRPDLPRAASGTGDRIAQVMRVAVYGYTPRWDADRGFCFWHPRTNARTSAHQDYAAACVAAERELNF